MEINKMTRKQFQELPRREWNEDVGAFDSLIILPLRRLHGSGYRLLDFVAVKDGKPICRLSGCSDVIHIEGIGGFGFDWLNRYTGCPKLVPPIDWSIDCLKKSGLLRMFCQGEIRVGIALSSFEIYGVNREIDAKSSKG